MSNRLHNLSKTDQYLVAVSGGSDSIFLLHQLINLQFTNLIVCHVNFFIPNYQAFKNLVIQHASAQKLIFESIDCQIDTNINKEHYMRVFLLNYLATISKKYMNVKACFLGHNLHDKLETFLMQKQKQSYVNYYGLPWKITLNNIIMYRPFLHVHKQTILKFLQTHHLQYLHDCTNDDHQLLRNNIRKNIVQPANQIQIKTCLVQIRLANQHLISINQQLKKWIPSIIIFPNLLLIDCWKLLNYELQIRIIYIFLINMDDQIVLNKKKSIVKEIHKQLNGTLKHHLLININHQWTLVKRFNVCFLKKSNIY